MTYHERELLVSRSSQSYPHKRSFNNSNKRLYSSRFLPSQTFRIECKTEERHFINNISSYTINSSFKPIRYKMNEQIKPVQFRSEIIVHNNPESDLQINRLRVKFNYHDDTPSDAILNNPSYSLSSSHIPRSSLHEHHHHHQQQNDDNVRRRNPSSIPSQSQAVLHQWIDDMCANEELMSNEDIVFFIKNGEFFARI